MAARSVGWDKKRWEGRTLTLMGRAEGVDSSVEGPDDEDMRAGSGEVLDWREVEASEEHGDNGRWQDERGH